MVKNDKSNSDTALLFSNRGGGEALFHNEIIQIYAQRGFTTSEFQRGNSDGAQKPKKEVFDMIEDMKIFHKTYEFIKWVHTLLNKFPKSEKYTMAQKIENTALNFLESIIQSNNDFDKKESLQKAIIELDKLRIFFRLSKDLQFISFAQYEYGSNLINEIGRMLGGWYKKYANIPS